MSLITNAPYMECGISWMQCTMNAAYGEMQRNATKYYQMELTHNAFKAISNVSDVECKGSQMQN